MFYLMFTMLLICLYLQVGTYPLSLAVTSNGTVLSCFGDSEESTAKSECEILKPTDTIGFLIYIPSPSDGETSAFLRININGKLVALTNDVMAAFTDHTSELASLPLFPTVSLSTDDAKIWCRFSEGDIVSRFRSRMGAPPDARVYCLDGTLLLRESDR